MGRNRKKKKQRSFNIFSNLNKETIHGVWAVIFFVLGLFFLLAATEAAGIVGTTTFHMLSLLLGVGYYLLPLLSFILAISFFKSLRHEFGSLKIMGSILFFLSSIGLINTIFSEKGGIIGGLITKPLVALFDVYVALFFLWGLLIISLLVLFNAALPTLSFLTNIFKRKEEKEKEHKEDGEESAAEEYEEDEDGEEEDEGGKAGIEEYEEDGASEKLSPIQKVIGFGSKKNKAGGLFTSHGTEDTPYTRPPLSLLEKDKGKPDVGDIKANANIIKRTLQNFGINVEVDEISIGPTVTRYALKPAEGVRLAKIIGLQNNLELALAAHPVRIEAPIPGRSLVGVEVPNTSKATVGLATLLSSEEYQASNKPLSVVLGKDITGSSYFADIAKMPHLLIAGATGSGKSVAIHALITSLLYRNSPQHLRFILIDPKRVELTLYNNIPHLLTPVITDSKKTILALKWAAREMERRYDVLETESVRDITSYHKNILTPALKKLKNKKHDNEESAIEAALPEQMPHIVIIIDEIADIMQAYPRELESAVVRLAQMSRAVGIHLILSTQRPSVNVITGLIKANIPARMALQVASQIDSRTILDTGGAEKLLGAGDMLYLSGDMSKPKRMQTAFISEAEVKKVVKFIIKNHHDHSDGERDEIDFTTDSNPNALFEASLEEDAGSEEDALYEDARETVLHAGKASTSYLQRKLRVGYSRAARLMDMLEERGVIGPGEGAKPREVLEKLEDSSDDEEENNR